jgi:phasin family protein
MTFQGDNDMAAKKSDDNTAPGVETAEGAIEIAAEAATEGFTETVTALKNGMSGAAAGHEKTQAEIKSRMGTAMKTVEEVVSFNQGNVEAAIKSGQIWADGIQDLSKSLAATAQAQLDQTMSTWKALSTVKSLKDVFDLQSNLARSSMDTFVSETGKLTDASLKLTEQALAPLTARFTLAAEKFRRAAA